MKTLLAKIPSYSGEEPPITQTANEASPQGQPQTPAPTRPKSNSPTAPIITEFTTPAGLVYTVLMNEAIEHGNDQMIELLYILDHAKTGDIIKLLLCCPGGSIVAGTIILNAMNTTKAKVITIANGECASMAAIILSYGHEIEVRPWGSIMFHDPAHGDWDKSLRIREHADDVIKFFNFIVEPIITKGLLREEEYMQICKAKEEKYLSAEEFQLRIDAMKGATA